MQSKISKKLNKLKKKQEKLAIEEANVILKAMSGNSVEEILAANKAISDISTRKDPGLKSQFVDPNTWGQDQGYVQKRTRLSFNSLRKMAKQPIIRSIISTRQTQVSDFSSPQTNRFGTGFVIRKKKEFYSEDEVEYSDEEKKKRIWLTEFIMNCGDENNRWFGDNFDKFLKKVTADSLELDQGCFEVKRNRKGTARLFQSVDGATIMVADTLDDRVQPTMDRKRIKGYLPSHVQVIDGQVMADFYPWELCVGIRNATTDIRSNGYGRSELEDLISIVTYMLYSDAYNGKFFCLSEDTLITSSIGNKRIKDLSNKSFEIHNGSEWVKARAFKTKNKVEYITTLNNGLSIKSSEDHLFYVIRDDYSPIWVKQKDLLTTDYVLIDESAKDYSMDYSSFKIGKKYQRLQPTPNNGKKVANRSVAFTPTKEMLDDVDFWEMIGFYFADGHLDDKSFILCPHYKNDAMIFDKYIELMNKYGIKNTTVTVSQKIERKDGGFGYPLLRCSQVAFVDWMIEIGFSESCNGKKMPSWIYSLPLTHRRAILRGWFSGDGHTEKNTVHKYKTPTVTCVNEDLRAELIMLSTSCGLSVNHSPTKSNSGRLMVRDSMFFAKNIGYIQDYKNEGILRNSKTMHRNNMVAKNAAKSIAKEVYNSNKFYNLPRKYKLTINAILRGDRNISNFHLKNICDIVGLEYECLKFRHEQPKSFINTGQKVSMYDVEVFDDKHLFFANFIGVHNSNGSAPKGIMKIKGNVNRGKLMEFKQQWIAQMSGVNNAWKMPVLEGDMEYVDLQKGNRDMEFSEWQKYLIRVACAVYKISPEECGFDLDKSGGGGGITFESNNEQKLKYSRDKGLKPLLNSIEWWINKWIIQALDPKFEFAFVGLEAETEDKELDLLNKKVEHGMGYKEYRKALGLPEELAEGDFPLNAAFIQMTAQLAMSEQGEAVTDDEDDEDGGVDWEDLGSDEAFEETLKAHEGNPMMADLFRSLNVSM